MKKQRKNLKYKKGRTKPKTRKKIKKRNKIKQKKGSRKSSFHTISLHVSGIRKIITITFQTGAGALLKCRVML